jgi:uncharacterized SAM-binding protein YcdF (DUF218 family)
VIRFLVRLVLFALILYALGFALFASTLPKAAGDDHTDAIVVLTGGTGRLDRGFDLMRRGLAQRMLISGVAPTVRPRDLIVAYRVEPRLFICCITLGREAVDTRSNADEVAHWLAGHRAASIRLVTNDLHMPRARYELRKRIGGDINILADAVPTQPGLRAIFIEYNKYLLGRAADLVGL